MSLGASAWKATYRAGLVQAVREMPAIKAFLETVGVSGFRGACPRSFPRHFKHSIEIVPNPTSRGAYLQRPLGGDDAKAPLVNGDA